MRFLTRVLEICGTVQYWFVLQERAVLRKHTQGTVDLGFISRVSAIHAKEDAILCVSSAFLSLGIGGLRSLPLLFGLDCSTEFFWEWARHDHSRPMRAIVHTRVPRPAAQVAIDLCAGSPIELSKFDADGYEWVADFQFDETNVISARLDGQVIIKYRYVCQSDSTGSESQVLERSLLWHPNWMQNGMLVINDLVAVVQVYMDNRASFGETRALQLGAQKALDKMSPKSLQLVRSPARGWSSTSFYISRRVDLQEGIQAM